MISNILGAMKDQYNSELDNIQPNMINLMGDNIGKKCKLLQLNNQLKKQ